MKKRLLEITLGVVTSIGGFLDAGSMATSAQAGARFGFELMWAVVLGTICAIALIEMSGRLAIVTHHPLRELIHERFGLNFSVLLLLCGLVLNTLVLASEIGGICTALQVATGISVRWWAIPVALACWALLWGMRFGVLEKTISFVGLITLAFVVGAFKLHPGAKALLPGMLPSVPTHDAAGYWYLAVSIVGSTITPFMFFFYSSGVIEDGWKSNYLGVNRAVAVLGMAFGSVVALAIVIVSAGVLGPRGIRVETYDEAAAMLNPFFGSWGLLLFALSLGIASLGAAVEVSLSTAYEVAQTFGWNWGKEQKARKEARFSVTYSLAFVVAALPILLGVSPLSLTVFTMALACLELPLVTFPVLVLMNDRVYLGDHVNRRWSNSIVVAIVALAFLLAVVAIPLQIFGG